MNHNGRIMNSGNTFKILNFRPKKVTTFWTLPSTTTSTWMGLAHVKAPLLAPLVMSCSHPSVIYTLPELVWLGASRRILPRLMMRRQTKSWTCWTLPLVSLKSLALAARCNICPKFDFFSQVCMTKALDGVVVKVPEGVNDQRWE